LLPLLLAAARPLQVLLTLQHLRVGADDVADDSLDEGEGAVGLFEGEPPLGPGRPD
jgi:hypothetical protein